MQVNSHDFPSHVKGKAVRYGIDDLAGDEGWVWVEISCDTAQFAGASIEARWEHLGRAL